MNTFERVRDVIATSLGADAGQITPETVIAEDLGADSLAMVELVMALEDEFGISVPEEDAKEIKTVGDVVKMVDSKA